MNRITSFIIFLIIILVNSCSNYSHQASNLSEHFSIKQYHDGHTEWARLQKFKTEAEALNYALDRRLIIQRFHQLKSEPYFGTPAQKECADNLDLSGKVETIAYGQYFYLKVLVNDQFSMGDCLKENNTKEAYYEFFICKNGQLIEVRNYQEYNNSPPTLKRFQCDKG